MQSFRMSAIAAGAALVCGAAFAQVPPFKGEAKLVSPVEAARVQSIAGVAWNCDGNVCRGVADRRPNLDNPVRECKKVVSVVGPVASYRSGGYLLTAGQLRACNTAAAVETAAR